MTLYYLSKDKLRQNIALEDIRNNSQSYLRACIKESMRLAATAGASMRKLPVDIVMNGYHIPAEVCQLQ